ncbi:MAG TPA: hypothetical protein VGI40_08440 [Pirellulaceae bacterium]|jgi:hypothetical protein
MTLFPSASALRHQLQSATWIDRGLVVAVLLSAATALSLNVADPDLWGHVQYGRDALRHGLPATTTYSYVAEGYPWINHEILAEYALAVINDIAGGPGLLITKCLLGVAVIGAMMLHARRQGAGLVAICSLALLVAIALGNHWSLRPQLASYVSFALLLALLSYAFQGWEGEWQLPIARFNRFRGQTTEQPSLEYSLPRLKTLWLAPPLFMLWTNAHGGFLAGLCIYIAYLGLRSFEAVCRNGRAADGLVLRFALMAAAAIAATFVNPYGANFHVWLFDDLKVPRPEIVEWRAPEFFDTQFLPFWLLLSVSVTSAVFSKRPRDFTHLIILGLIVWQSLTHHRHIAFFAIACGWWLPMHWNSLLSRLGVGKNPDDDAESSVSDYAASNSFAAKFSPKMQIAFGLLLAVTIGITGTRLWPRLTTLKVERERYPVAAFDFVARQHLTGKMVCTFNWAQYALAAIGPHETAGAGILVQIDGRCRTSYSQAMLDAHFDFLMGPPNPTQRYRDPKSGPFDPERVLREGNPDLVLVSRLQKPSVEVMERQNGRWALLYQDSLAQVWGRADRFDDPQGPDYLPPTSRSIGDDPQTGFVVWPAMPKLESTLVTAEKSADF